MILRLLPAAALLAASAAPAQPAAEPSQIFGARENVEQIDISPDGTKVVFLQPGPGRTSVVFIADVAGGGEPRLVVRSDGNPERFRWCNFATNDRLVCRLSGMTRINGVLAPFYRLVSVDTNGQNMIQLGQHQSLFDSRLRLFDGSILDWTGGETGAVLMVRDVIPEAGRTGSLNARTADGLSVERVDLRTGRSARVEAPNRRAGGYISDGHGHVRMMAVPQARGATGQADRQVDFFYRTQDSRDWRPFGSYDMISGDGMDPLAVDAASNSAYVRQKLNGRYALYRVKLDGSMASELVHASDRVDVDGVVWSSRGERVIGVTFGDEQQRVVYFDPDYASLTRSLGRAIPNLPLIDFSGASVDGNRILVHAGADNDPGRYYVYDRATRNLNEILLDRPQLENVPLAQVRPVNYPAPDGTSIPGYLTLPPGREARNLPVVILPHGGPDSRDTWRFDWLAQYFANRGYAVLQANYRGSSGYGDAWLRENGFRSWRTSIGDISAGARWLAAQGIGDANRMAIVGWSYGGYAALQAGATDPGLFRAIVAIAPVTDLMQLKEDARHYGNRANLSEYLGDGPHLREGSPLQNVATITAPVLLFHGDRDLNVNVIHSRRMDDALRGARKRSELVVFDGLEHDLADSDARTQMLQRIGAFLDESLARQ